MWSSSWSRVPHPLLHFPPEPSLPGLAALLHRQQLRGPSLLAADQGEASSTPGLLDHPWGHWSWTPSQQGGHCGPQPGSQTKIGLYAACDLHGSDSGSSGAREAVWAVQHPGREGMSGSTGILHDGDGTDTSGDTAPQSRRKSPGAVLRGHSHWLDTENPEQTHRISAATAERHGEIILYNFLQREKMIKKVLWINVRAGRGTSHTFCHQEEEFFICYIQSYWVQQRHTVSIQPIHEELRLALQGPTPALSQCFG